MNDEILGGIKNAMEHGSSFEEAVQAFINAGYNQEDVREVSSFLASGAKPLPLSSPSQPSQPVLPQMPKQKTDSSTTLIIILIIVLLVLILLGILGLVFKEQIISFFAPPLE